MGFFLQFGLRFAELSETNFVFESEIIWLSLNGDFLPDRKMSLKTKWVNYSATTLGLLTKVICLQKSRQDHCAVQLQLCTILNFDLPVIFKETC